MIVNNNDRTSEKLSSGTIINRAPDVRLYVPNAGVYIIPGSTVKLHRFETEIWAVGFGWFSFGGNREWCGWYLTCEGKVKPLQKTDLDDMYVITDPISAQANNDN